MPKGIYAAASAMVTETKMLETTARNIAHAQTPGYRREGVVRVGFAEILAGEGRNGGIKRDGGAGVMADGRYTEFTDGLRDPTGGTYDLALHGEGFFTVRDAQGKTWLTRNGNFKLDLQGRLATREGHLVMGQGGPITIPEPSPTLRWQPDAPTALIVYATLGLVATSVALPVLLLTPLPLPQRAAAAALILWTVAGWGALLDGAPGARAAEWARLAAAPAVAWWLHPGVGLAATVVSAVSAARLWTAPAAPAEASPTG